MAKFAFTDGYISIGGTVLSSWAKSITVTLPTNMVDVTTMGVGQKVYLSGLKDIGVQATFEQDFAAGGPDAVLSAMVGGSSVVVAVRPTSGARSVTNPEYNCAMIVESYTPITGAVGVAAECTVSLKPAGAWSRLTA